MDDNARADNKARKDRYLSRMQRNPNDRLHGTNQGYRYGCRCARCRQAMRDYDAGKKERFARKMKAMREAEANERLRALKKSAMPCEVEIHGVGKVAI